MLKYKLLHPEILAVLGSAGHGAKILIADSNYPFITRANPAAERVYLNFAPGLINATDVLRVLVDAIPIEAADVMVRDDGSEAPIVAEFRALLPPDVPVRPHMRFDFYQACMDEDTALVIATGEQRVYANILLTIGVVFPPQ
ncbi:MAG: RbsD/FucU family protein [Anaerolineae bacterium]|nr:RbsD/FucU family protein [Thermoflexales bacterium]MDW8394881.1 RbsD/FucU family protein [Anaerolineae bacterium]